MLVTQPPDKRYRHIRRTGYCCWSATVWHLRTCRPEEPDVSIWLRIGANGKDPTGVRRRLKKSVTAPVELCHNWKAFHFCCSFLRLGTLARAAYSVQSIFYDFLNFRRLSTDNSGSSSLLTDCRHVHTNLTGMCDKAFFTAHKYRASEIKYWNGVQSRHA